MRTRWATLLMAGCFAETHAPTCAPDPEPVGDDLEVGGASGATLVERVAGTRVEAGAYEDGAPVDLTLEVRRTGDAQLVRTTPGTRVSPRLGLGTTVLMVYVPCSDYVRVPVELRVTTADGATDVVVDTFAAGPMEDGGAAWAENGALSFSGHAEMNEVTLPFGADDPADYDDPYGFASATFPEVGGVTTGAAGWGGSRQTAQSSSSSAFYLLEW